MINWRHIKQVIEQNMFLEENNIEQIEAEGPDSFRIQNNIEQNEILIDEDINLIEENESLIEENKNLMLEIERLQNEVQNCNFEKIVIILVSIFFMFIICLKA